MIGAIVRWITGGGLSGVASSLRQAHKDKLDAQNDEQRIQADITIRQLEARQNALIEGQMSWISKVVQAAWATPFIIYNAKVIVWDKVFKLGVTDPSRTIRTEYWNDHCRFLFPDNGCDRRNSTGQAEMTSFLASLMYQS